jgi:acyl-coenzyme A thioesterase PaaI-like protein
MAAEGAMKTRHAADAQDGFIQGGCYATLCNAMLSYAIYEICYAMLSNAKLCYAHIAQASAGTVHLKQLKSKSKGKEAKCTDEEAADFAAPSRVQLIVFGGEDLQEGSEEELGAPIHAASATGQVGARHKQEGNATSTRLYAVIVPKAKIKFRDKCVL